MISVDFMCIVHSYNMGDKMRMIMTFEYICQKEQTCLTYGRIVHLYKMYPTLHDDYQVPKIRYATFQFIWLRLWDQENGVMNKLKEQDMLS